MKCPKCGYNSFEHQDLCKKCGLALAGHKEKFNLRGFFNPGQPAASRPTPDLNEDDYEADQAEDGRVDFGFDFLDAEDRPTEEVGRFLADDGENLSIDQPFGVDSEAVPTDQPTAAAKKDKESDFSF